MSSSQILGNNGGVAVPVAVDANGDVRVSVSGPVSGNLYATDGSSTVAVAGAPTGQMLVRAIGTTSGGALVPLLVDTQGRVVTSGGGGPGPPGPPGYSTAILPYRANGITVPTALSFSSTTHLIQCRALCTAPICEWRS